MSYLSVHTSATVAYGAVRAYAQAVGHIGMPAWWELSEPQKHFWNSMGELALDSTSQADLHAKWIEWAESNGWKLSNTIDWQAFTHTNLVEWKDLSSVEKVKYKLFYESFHVVAEGGDLMRDFGVDRPSVGEPEDEKPAEEPKKKARKREAVSA